VTGENGGLRERVGLVISGDEATVRSRLVELLDQGLDEGLAMLVPVADETAEHARLVRLIGEL